MIEAGDDLTQSSPETMIFDPGGSDHNSGVYQQYFQELLASRYPEAKRRVCVLREGYLGINGVDRHRCSKILLDSGALNSSYISQELVERYAGVLGSGIREAKGTVMLGDNETTATVTGKISLPVTILDDNDGETTASIDMWVWSMPGTDIIIGLPDLVDHYLDTFVSILEKARSDSKDIEYNTSMASEEVVPGQLREPWTTATADDIPEDMDTEVPCNFSSALSYLTRPYQDIIEDYEKQIDIQVSSDFAAYQLGDITKEHPELQATTVEDLFHTELFHDCFCPKQWKGIEGFDPLELEFDENMPSVHKVHAYPINPKIFEPTRLEVERLCTYMWKDSDSPVACPMVVAPKATPPYVRMCGDYRWINQWVRSGQYYIPHASKELNKAAGFKYFLDLDLTNAFHQIRLGPKTSNLLSVLTPWGLKRPKFLPEGVAPASGILQRMVATVYADFSDWCIVMFDNMLILCDSMEDAAQKLIKIVKRSVERSVALKFTKSWFGVQQVKFFGYKVTPGQYELDEDRKQAVQDSPMPRTKSRCNDFLESQCSSVSSYRTSPE